MKITRIRIYKTPLPYVGGTYVWGAGNAISTAIASVVVVDTDAGCVIVAPAKAATFKKWHNAKDQFAYAVLEALVRPCLIHPDVAGFEAILKEHPGALTRVANAIVKMAGTASKEVSEK